MLLVLRPAPGLLAAEYDIGDDWRLRWDNSVRATLGFRVAPQDGQLLANINGDDGDRAFQPGINSERLDLLSEFDLDRGNAGFDLSADGWYDAVYHRSTTNHSQVTFNPVSVPSTQFPADVRALQGGTAELLNAYGHDKLRVFGTEVTLRAGRQTVLWGESLFSTGNGIAAGQAPVDQIKAASQPLAQAKELFLPVAQADIDVALSQGLHLEAYVQGEWRRDRTPGVASYFSASDTADVGGQRYFADGGYYLRGPDRVARGGQFGLALHGNTGAFDFGVYALRFDSKSPEFYLSKSGAGSAGSRGRYGLVFPGGISLYGTSFSTYIGDSTLSGEVSLRTHMPLVSRFPPLGDGSADYAIGRSLHAQVSTATVLPPSRFWQGASLLAEITANDRLAIDHDPAAAAPGRDRFAASLQVEFSPQYFEVLPHLDLSPDIGIVWNAIGNSSVLGSEDAHAGNAEIGLDATYRVVWQGTLSYTRFIGSPHDNALADRDFVSLSVTRTF